MKVDKLFNILVLGGTLITAQNAQANESEGKQKARAVLQELLKAEPVAPELALCKTEPDTCVVEDGKSVPRAGIVCCWGTSCEG